MVYHWAAGVATKKGRYHILSPCRIAKQWLRSTKWICTYLRLPCNLFDQSKCKPIMESHAFLDIHSDSHVGLYSDVLVLKVCALSDFQKRKYTEFESNSWRTTSSLSLSIWLIYPAARLIQSNKRSFRNWKNI